MSTQPTGPVQGPSRRRGPVGILIAFLAGVVLTAVAGVALLGFGIATVGDAEEAMDADVTAAAGATATAAPTATEAPSASEVPESCVRASEHSLALSEALDQIAVGVRDQDARTVQEALDAVQDAEAEADGGAEQCLDLAGERRSADEP